MEISANAYYSDSCIYTYRQTSRCSKFLLKMQFFLWPFRSTCSSHIPVKHPNPLKHAPLSTDYLFQIHHRSQPLSQWCSARPRTQYRKTWVKPLSRILPPAFGVLQRFVFSTMADCSMDRWVTHKLVFVSVNESTQILIVRRDWWSDLLHFVIVFFELRGFLTCGYNYGTPTKRYILLYKYDIILEMTEG